MLFDVIKFLILAFTYRTTCFKLAYQSEMNSLNFILKYVVKPIILKKRLSQTNKYNWD